MFYSTFLIILSLSRFYSNDHLSSGPVYMQRYRVIAKFLFRVVALEITFQYTQLICMASYLDQALETRCKYVLSVKRYIDFQFRFLSTY